MTAAQTLSGPSVEQMHAHIAALEQLLEVHERTVAEQSERLQQALETVNAYAMDLQRSNQELELFAYVALHDLQEPLRMVSSYTQLLGSRYRDKLDDNAREFIDYAVGGAQRMQSLINGLLEYSRVGTRSQTLQPMSLATALDAATANVSVAITEHQASVETSGELPRVMGDVSQLTQLLQNLISNSLKFRGEEPPRILVSASREKAMWKVTVRDNGIGMDQKYADRVFLMFQRLHTLEEYPGTGIGLAVAKKIVERHGGRIWVESSPGAGAAFHFTLGPVGGTTP